MRNALIIQNQANADTRYDIYPPPRVEGFSINLHKDTIITCVSILAIFVILTFLILYSRHTVMRVVLIAASIISIHYAVGRLEKRTV